MAKKILIVNDEEDVAAVTKDMLDAEGFESIVASSGEDAISWLEKNNCDLILLDILLTGIQGDELCKRLKASDEFKNIPVVLLSANAGDAQKIIGDTGADDYVTIPYDPEALIIKIKKFVSLK